MPCSGAAAAVDYLGPLATPTGHMRGWHLSPTHLVERSGHGTALYLIAYEVLRHREDRATIRAGRGTSSAEHIARLENDHL